MQVAVLGNSGALLVAPRRTAAGTKTYAQHLETLLADADGPARVHNASRFARMIDAAAADWGQVVLGLRPDLVVVHHGVIECRTGAQPLALMRWTYGFAHDDGFSSKVAQRVWAAGLPVVLRAAAAADARAPLPGHMGPTQFGRQLDRLVQQTGEHLGARVAVLDLPTATPYLLRDSPRYGVRRDRMQAVLETVVGRHVHAYRVDVAAVEQDLGLRQTYGDGIHFTAQAHARVAELIAAGFRSTGPAPT